MEGGDGRRSECRGVFSLIFVCIATTLLLQSSFSAATSVHHGSLKAELFHRDHPFSRTRSTQHLGDSDKSQNNGSTSAAESFERRRLADDWTNTPKNRSLTWEANVTDGAQYEYLMMISLGTPAQEFVAVADTGSSLTWLQCEPCTDCYSQPSPIFDPTASSTYQSLSCSSTACSVLKGTAQNPSCNSTCGYYQGYLDGSYTEGNFSSETINLESTNGSIIAVPDFWFGCSYSSVSPSGLFDSTDGLIGLGPENSSLPSQLGRVFEDKFSYCLVNRSVAGVQSSLLLFGKDAALDLELQYTPILSNPVSSITYYYYISIEGISVGGTAVQYNATAFEFDNSGNGGTFIDSGTTYTRLSPLAFEPLQAAIIANVPSSYQRVPALSSYFALCYNDTEWLNHGEPLPEISFKLANNTSWNLSFENAWVDFRDENAFCLSIFPNSDLGDASILGNAQQRDFFVLYDRVESRLGFRKTDCGAASLAA